MSAAVDHDRNYHNTTRDARASARSKTRPTVRENLLSNSTETADLDKIIRRESHTHARQVPARALSPVVRVVSQRTLPVPIRYSPSVEARRREVKARLKWTDKMASTALIGSSARLAPTVVAKVSRTRQSRAHRSYRVRAAAKEDKGEPEAGTPTIDSKSLWRLRLELFSGKDANASAPDRTVTVRARFVVDEGYEPPQGSIEIEDDEELAFVQAGFHRWTMAEVRRHTALKNCPTRVSIKLTDSTSGTAQDPNERKDGLWDFVTAEQACATVNLALAPTNTHAARDLAAASKALVQEALDRGGTDNVSVLLVDLRDSGSGAVPAAGGRRLRQYDK